MKKTRKVERAVLAYSGGLDTSIIVPWLREHYGSEVVCYCSDVGQGDELEGLEARARRLGASRVVVEDLRLPFLRDFVFPSLRAAAVYEGRYLLGTSLARPLIAARQVACAGKVGADALAHGCTGKGNDQVRFELTYLALAPHLTVIAPWREWDIVSREDALAYARAHDIPVQQTARDLFSRDANLWHLSHEGGPLEDPAEAPPESMFRLTAAAERQPALPETVTVGFESGRPVSLDGRTLDPVALVSRLNALAGRHGVGRADLVESRLVGMKSRGVYETPAGTVLHEALEDLCRLVLPHDLLRTRAELAPRMADLIYAGLWFTPLRRALQAFADAALEVATGSVTVELHRGQARVVSRTSPRSLYRPDLASFDMTGYDATHAEGFIRLFGLPVATVARRDLEANGNGAAARPFDPGNGSSAFEAGPAEGRREALETRGRQDAGRGESSEAKPWMAEPSGPPGTPSAGPDTGTATRRASVAPASTALDGAPDD
jgi:argininosuccinate synthase